MAELDDDQTRIEQVLRARHPCVIVSTSEEAHAVELVKSAVMHTLDPMWIWTVTRGLRDAALEDADPIKKTEHPAAALYHMAHQLEGRSICIMLDLADHLDDERTLRTLREAIHRFAESGSTLFLIDHKHRFPDVIEQDALRLPLALPDLEELESIVRSTLRRLHKTDRIDVKLTRREMDIILRNLSGLTRRQAMQIVAEAAAEDRRFDADDINHVIAAKRRHLQESGVLEYVETPVDLDQIGGLRNLKRWLAQRCPDDARSAADFGLRPPRGVLLLGVQGAGKSLSAKAIATAWHRPLLRLDPGALYDRYVGESERRLRRALEQAEMMAPIVLWIDEIEKGFASAAAHSTDGGLSQRMFGALLTWMQEHEAPVFLVATANNVDALPPELLRKGRFDEIFFVDLPGDDTRRRIFEIHLDRRGRDPESFDLDALSRAASGYSGAEIEQAIISALHEAFAERGRVTTEHVLTALETSPPLSVTMAERVTMLREWAKGRCTPAD